MNCERFENLVSELARDELVEAGDRTAALTHVGECQRCECVWDEQRRLTGSLRALAKEMSLMAAPDHGEQRLRAAFRQQATVKTFPARNRWGLYWAGAAAAALLLVFGIITWRAQERAQPLSNQHNGIEATRSGPRDTPELPQAPAPDARRIVKNQPRPHRQVAATHRVRVGKPQPQTSSMDPNAATAEVVTDFLPVGYGNARDLQDGGQLVRVELPRFALARFGFPVNMDRADERVKADVLVGADGLARAIRFVR